MEYKSESIDYLKEEMKKRTVVFEYRKKDGTVRKASGTMSPDLLPEKKDDSVKIESTVIDVLMKEKGISSVDEYAEANGYVYSGEHSSDGIGYYVFSPVKKERKKSDDQVTYYDTEKESFRSFISDNFLGVIE